jgi:hypothetical protein
MGCIAPCTVRDDARRAIGFQHAHHDRRRLTVLDQVAKHQLEVVARRKELLPGCRCARECERDEDCRAARERAKRSHHDL